MRVWDNWADVHSNFSRVAQYPTVLWPQFIWNTEALSWYLAPIGALDFFIFFGFGQEARQEYTRVWNWFKTRVLHVELKPTSDSVLPTYSVRTDRVRHPLDSSDGLSINEKWDEEEAEIADAASSTSPSSSSSAGDIEKAEEHSPNPSAPIGLPHPSSAPQAETVEGGRRTFSLDLGALSAHAV